MTSEKIEAAINLVLTMAIEDYAVSKKISVDESRRIILASKAVESLMNPETGIWKEGPDAFIELMEDIG